jgi:hypothetical protein
MQQLEKTVTETAAVVIEWKNTISGIEAQFQTANLALAKAKKIREANALKASMGDAAAVAAVKLARAEQLAAEQTILDLEIARPAAQAQLAAAEKAAESARCELAKFHAEKLMRKRIDVAAELDVAIADFARLYVEYEKLGREVVAMDALPRSLHGMANHEGAVGLRRVRASLPSFFWRLFPGALHDEMKHEPLATSEARFWSLPEAETTTTKAA